MTNRSLNTVAAITSDPFNIYVQAGATGGNGSLERPFGTIPEGIAAVAPNGTVHILSGTYHITSQISVTKQGITLQGEPGNLIQLEANVIPFLVTGNNITLKDLTITSDIPYAKEFIQVGGNSNSIINNTIFGPPQPLPMSNWVVNRAVVTQAGAINVLIQGNTFYSLRTGMYLNPNSTGQVLNNIIYNTKGGILVDRSTFTISGNAWGTPQNEFDIVLLAGTAFGPPYDPLAVLSANNNGATISDQR